MFEIKVKIEIPGLMELAHAIMGKAQQATTSAAVAVPTAAPTPVQAPTAASQPVSVTAPITPSTAPVKPSTAPVTPPAAPVTSPAAPAVPTASPSYTLDDLARAAMTLMDAGRLNELQQLLTQFGVEALPMLPKDQYGAFATALRGLGAQI